ncbi:2,6-beta-D-fructofuranosidase [Clostridia bacterium]|nr:2,6-beta-D-fructofuranosidase [Clostridia bacterium]
MASKEFIISEGYLHLPVDPLAKKRYIRVSAQGRQIAEFHVSVTQSKPAFYCALALTAYLGQTVVLESDEEIKDVLNGVVPGGPIAQGNPLYPDLYQERLRPQYHFSSRRGWLNDPNGLVFCQGLYHLYYQHNPFGTDHGAVNIHWGHAVSTDAIHWVEKDDAIAPPNRETHIASGSALVDEEGVAGYGPDTIISAFTALGSMDYQADPPRVLPSKGQMLAYSVDGGDTYSTFPLAPAIPTQDGKSWRDPRLFPLAEGGFGIAVYETDETGNCVSFYQSKDFHHWFRTSRARDLYECPDIFKLKTQGGETVWVLYGADGTARLGCFENGIFTQSGPRMPLDYGDSTYAGQTWMGLGDETSRTHISWVRGMGGNEGWGSSMGYHGMPFSQCMSLPCLLTLENRPTGMVVCRNPLPSIASLRSTAQTISLHGGDPLSIPIQREGDADLRIESSAEVTIRFGRVAIVYDPKHQRIDFSNTQSVFLQDPAALCLRLLTDRTTAEFFIDHAYSATYTMDTEDVTLQITGQDVQISGAIYAMSSVWRQHDA